MSRPWTAAISPPQCAEKSLGRDRCRERLVRFGYWIDKARQNSRIDRSSHCHCAVMAADRNIPTCERIPRQTRRLANLLRDYNLAINSLVRSCGREATLTD